MQLCTIYLSLRKLDVYIIHFKIIFLKKLVKVIFFSQECKWPPSDIREKYVLYEVIYYDMVICYQPSDDSSIHRWLAAAAWPLLGAGAAFFLFFFKKKRKSLKIIYISIHIENTNFIDNNDDIDMFIYCISRECILNYSYFPYFLGKY